MVLDWFNETRGSGGSVAELIARKKYARAIEALRAQFKGRSPDAKTRLQLADLMVLAGREDEAIPILIGLADEFAADGFVAKAVAILKRIEKLDPSRPEVEQRLNFLVNETFKAPPAAPPVRFVPPRRLEIGMEAESEAPLIEAEPETRDPEPILIEPEPATTPEAVATPASPGPEAPPHPQAPPLPGPLPLPEPPPLPVALDLPAATPTSQPDVAASPVEGAKLEDAARPAVARRIRSILGRLLAARRPAEGAAPEADASAPAATDHAPPPETAVPLQPENPGDEPGPAEPVVVTLPSQPPVEAALQAEAPAGATPVVEPEPPVVEPEEPAVVEAEPAPPETVSAPVEGQAEAAPVAPEPEAIADPEHEPESMAHRLRGFLGRLWGRPGEDHGEGESDGPRDDGVADPDEFDLSPDALEPLEAEEAPATATSEAAAPQSADAIPSTAPAPTEAPPLVATAPEPKPDPEPGPPATEPPPPLPDAPREEPPPGGSPDSPEDPPMSEEVFHERLLDVIEDVLKVGATRAPRTATRVDGRKLADSPLLGGLGEKERLKLVHQLKLLCYEPGDVILTEGEPGETLFMLTTGAVKVFVRNPASRNIEVRELREGDFFGEVSILSGRPRTATITAASDCELLELDRPTLDALGHEHPGIVDTLEAYYIERTQSPDNAAVRAAAVADAETQRRAAEVLRAHFGDRAWDPRMRLKLAELLLKAQKPQEALPILVDLADAMARQGHPEKAIAILKKIERIEGRHTEEISLAPLGRRATGPSSPPLAPEPAARRRSREMTSDFFQGWMVDLVKDTVKSGLPSAYRLPASLASSAGLLLSPLFEDFSDEEIQALIDGLRLLVFEPGDIVMTEGEPGNSVLVVTSGAVKVFVRSPSGHNAEVCELREGDFFGEISTLSGRPRSATVTAAARTEVLELDKRTLDAICAAHPRVRAVLEDVYIQRAAHPYAALVRGVQQPAS
jgi:CRP-like cAMP-binding protein